MHRDSATGSLVVVYLDALFLQVLYVVSKFGVADRLLTLEVFGEEFFNLPKPTPVESSRGP